VLAVPSVLMDDALYLQINERRILELRMPRLLERRQSTFPPELSFAQAAEIIERLTPPYFLWVHVMAPHYAYQPSPPFLNRFLPRNDMRTLSDIVPLLDGDRGRYSSRSQAMISQWRLRYDEWIAQADGRVRRLRGTAGK
jgi:hypothetical protein